MGKEGSLEISAKMVRAGATALAAARRRELPDDDIACEVYRAMRASDESVELDRVRQFARETIFNIRGALETLKRCERRASEHFELLERGKG